MANSQVTPPILLRPALESDLGAVMALERGPGYEDYVGRSTRDEHAAMLASPRYKYLVGHFEPQGPFAFAILRDFADPETGCYLKRVAVDAPGRGRGVAFLAAVIGRAFAEGGAPRFHLDCFVENTRAQRAYEKLGLTRDGVRREAYVAPDGRRRDLLLMSLTRPAWQAREAESPPGPGRRAAP